MIAEGPGPADALPLTAAQHGIWTGQQLDPSAPVYNAGEYVLIDGPLDRGHFTAALHQVVGEAEALRARIVAGPDGPYQVIGTPSWELTEHDVYGAADPEASAVAVMRAMLADTVDLDRGPLFRHALFRLGPARFAWYQQIHHVAADGYSFALLARRVAAVYTALVAGEPVPGPAFGPLAPVVAADAAYDPAADRAFWLAHLADAPPPTSLSGSAAPMTARTLRASTALATRIRPEPLLAAVAAHVGAAGDVPEVTLGLPVALRLGGPALRTPCMLMNIVPLRVELAGRTTGADVAAAVAARLRRIRPHQRYRYEQLRRDLGLVGGGRRLFGPVVNVLPFDFTLTFAGHPATTRALGAGPVEDLSVTVADRGDGPVLTVEANPDRYTPDELAAHRDAILALVADPSRRLGRPARPTAPVVLDGPPLAEPPAGVLDRIAAHARTRPDAVAVQHAGAATTYAELAGRARAVAGRLRGAGVGPGDLVALALPRGIDAVVAILGVLRAGAGYLPLDVDAPVARTAALLADARPVLVITAPAHPVPAGEVPILTITAATPAAGEPADAVEPVGSDDLAYVIYTSGSTGRPKGVEVSRGALDHFVAAACARYAVTAADRVLQFAPLHFDASVEELFVTLCAGATLVVRTEDLLESVPTLLRGCAELGVTVLDLPTAYWHELAYAVANGATLPDGLHTVIIGGEAALPERVARWREALGDRVRLLNTYGPTECTVVATVADLHGIHRGRAEATAAIGRPLPGVRAAVLPLPDAPAGTGELYLLGPTLARGYRGETAEATRFAPLRALPGAPRAYRTGDLVRVDADGELVFAGRVDDEVKISGHRIDPAEVENALLSHPDVREAAVVGHPCGGGLTRLVAHVVTDVDPARLRRHAAALLPPVLVPGRYIPVASLPRNTSGKIDRKALRAPDEDRAAAALHPTERLVAAVWAEVLGTAAAAADDDFFVLGGQSLQAIQVANRLAVSLGRDVPVSTVFECSTLAALAARLDGTAPADAGPDLRADAVLPAGITPATGQPGAARTAPVAPVSVLTGATGFVGGHLLAELLRTAPGRIVCPVRAEDPDAARERVVRALAATGRWIPGWAERVTAVPADLSRPHLGLPPDAFADLAAAADVVYHNAAVVSVVRGYRSLRGPNVDGTREVLRLACAVRPSPVHHVSTLAVGPPAPTPLREEFLPAHAGLRDGYQQTKWAAEALVRQAGERGLPVAVYRLGRVVGPTDGTAVNERDLVWRLLADGARAGALPALAGEEVWTPVDAVARTLVAISRARPPAGEVYHFAPPPLRLADVVDWVAAYGYDLPRLPVPRWRERVAGSADAATLAFLDLNPSGVPAVGPVASDRVPATAFPAVDQTLVHRYLDHCVTAGTIPPPHETAPHATAPKERTPC